MRMRRYVSLIASTVVAGGVVLGVTGCGGGGSSSSTTSTTTNSTSTVISGSVADGIVEGATVCIDMDDNGMCDKDTTDILAANVTDANGSYTLTIPAGTNVGLHKLIAYGGRDLQGGKDFDGLLIAPVSLKDSSGQVHVTPLSTLVAGAMEENTSLNVNSAVNSLAGTFGLPAAAFKVNPIKVIDGSGAKDVTSDVAANALKQAIVIQKAVETLKSAVLASDKSNATRINLVARAIIKAIATKAEAVKASGVDLTKIDATTLVSKIQSDANTTAAVTGIDLTRLISAAQKAVETTASTLDTTTLVSAGAKIASKLSVQQRAVEAVVETVRTVVQNAINNGAIADLNTTRLATNISTIAKVVKYEVEKDAQSGRQTIDVPTLVESLAQTAATRTISDDAVKEAANAAKVSATPATLKLGSARTVTFGSQSVTVGSEGTFSMTRGIDSTTQGLSDFFNVSFDIDKAGINQEIKDSNATFKAKIYYPATNNYVSITVPLLISTTSGGGLTVKVPGGSRIEANSNRSGFSPIYCDINASGLTMTSFSDLASIVSFDVNTILKAIETNQTAIKEFLSKLDTNAMDGGVYVVHVGFKTRLDIAIELPTLPALGNGYRGFVGTVRQFPMPPSPPAEI